MCSLLSHLTYTGKQSVPCGIEENSCGRGAISFTCGLGVWWGNYTKLSTIIERLPGSLSPNSTIAFLNCILISWLYKYKWLEEVAGPVLCVIMDITWLEEVAGPVLCVVMDITWSSLTLEILAFQAASSDRQLGPPGHCMCYWPMSAQHNIVMW